MALYRLEGIETPQCTAPLQTHVDTGSIGTISAVRHPIPTASPSRLKGDVICVLPLCMCRLHRADLQHCRILTSHVITETDLPHLAGRALHEQRRSMQTIPRTPMTVLFRNCLQRMRTQCSCLVGMPALVAGPAGPGRPSGCSQPNVALMLCRDRSCRHAFCGAAGGQVELQSQVTL